MSTPDFGPPSAYACNPSGGLESQQAISMQTPTAFVAVQQQPAAMEDKAFAPSGPPSTAAVPAPHLIHSVLLLLACLLCAATFAFCCVVVASPYLWLITATYLGDQYNQYTETHSAQVGAFWFIMCDAYQSTDPSSPPDYYTGNGCDDNAGSAFTGSSKAAMVQALAVVCALLSIPPALLMTARSVRLLWKNTTPYSPRWDKVLIAALAASSTALLITVAALGSLNPAALMPQLSYRAPQSSSPGIAFSLLVAALVFSVVVLAYCWASYSRGVWRDLQTARGLHTATLPPGVESDLTVVSQWAAQSWHKVPLVGSVLCCLAVWALLVTVLASSSLYTVAHGTATTYQNGYQSNVQYTTSTFDIGPFAYSGCSSSSVTSAQYGAGSQSAPVCSSQQGAAWGGGGPWGAIQAFLVLSCLFAGFSAVLIVARAARFTMQRYHQQPYSHRWDVRLLALLAFTALCESIALGLVESYDVVSAFGGNQPSSYSNNYTQRSVGYVYAASVSYLIAALSLTAAVLVWYAVSIWRGVLRGMQVDQSRYGMYPAVAAYPAQRAMQLGYPMQVQQVRPQQMQPCQQEDQPQPQQQQIVLSPTNGDIAMLQAQLAAIKQTFPYANIIIAPVAPPVANVAAAPVQVQMAPMMSQPAYNLYAVAAAPQQQHPIVYQPQQQLVNGAQWMPSPPQQQPQYSLVAAPPQQSYGKATQYRSEGYAQQQQQQQQEQEQLSRDLAQYPPESDVQQLQQQQPQPQHGLLYGQDQAVHATERLL